MHNHITVTVKVPVEALDFSDCGDGQGAIYGLGCARVIVGTKYGTELLPVLEFADGPRATQLMHEALGTTHPPIDKKRAVAHYTTMARQAKDMAAELERRARA